MTVLEIEYKEMVARLAKPGDEIMADMGGAGETTIAMMHMALGIAGECGELVDIVKKRAIYCLPVDRVHLVEELGDLEYYIEGLRQIMNISRAETLEANIAKLNIRYPDGYTNKAALDRQDKVIPGT